MLLACFPHVLLAWQELRKLHPAPERQLDERPPAVEGEEATEGENVALPPNVPQRPIVISNGHTRRVNKVA